MLHQIGRLYILTHTLRADPGLRDDPGYTDVLQSWQAPIGAAILTAWGLPERIGEAVANQNDLLGGEIEELQPLPKLLSAAILRNRPSSGPFVRQSHPDADERMQTVSFGDNSFLDLVAASRGDIAVMQQALAA